MDQYNRISPQISDFQEVPFEKKKFCIFVSRNFMNDNKKTIVHKLMQLGEVDFISNYSELYTETCYHSPKLIQHFNNYKFVVCFENSNSDGYISEKIFNVFYSKSIPIYDGAPNVNQFINQHAYLAFHDQSLFVKIAHLAQNEKEYQEFVSQPKQSKDYNNENWVQVLKERMQSLAKHKNLDLGL